eukprot:SAG22_NODE_4494_length_1251_cov_1.618056_1_plen_100_part_00
MSTRFVRTKQRRHASFADGGGPGAAAGGGGGGGRGGDENNTAASFYKQLPSNLDLNHSAVTTRQLAQFERELSNLQAKLGASTGGGGGDMAEKRLSFAA